MIVVGRNSFIAPQTTGLIFMACGVARKLYITFSSQDLEEQRPGDQELNQHTHVDQFLSGAC